MRSWSLLVIVAALLGSLGSAKANNDNGGVLVALDPGVGVIDGESTALLNGVLSAVAHVDVDLGVDEHLALATAEVELGDLLAQLAADVGAHDAAGVLDIAVSVEDVLHAMATVATEDGELAAAAALHTLALDLEGMALGHIELGDLFDIHDMSLIDGMTIDLLDVTINMMSLWDQHHMIAPTTVMIDGDALDVDASILSASVDIDVMGPPRVVIGPEEISAEVSNIEVQVHADLADIEANLDGSGLLPLGAKIVIGDIDWCVFAPWVQARADVLDDENGAAMLDADVGRIHMCIGTATPGAIGEGGDQLDLDEVMPSMIGKIVVWIGGHEITVARVMARSVATVQADATAVLFNGDSKELLSLDLGATEAELFAQLFANIEIELEVLGHTLSPLQITALQSAAVDATLGALSLDLLDGQLLDGIVLPTLDVLGSGLTSVGIKAGGLIDLDGLAGGDDDGHHGSGDDDGDIDVDVDTDTDVDVSVDEDADLSVDMDTDVGVDVDTDGDAIDGDIDADVDGDVDVDVDEHGVNADVAAEGDVEVDVGDGMVGVGADADGRLSLAGGGCSVGGAPSGSASGLTSLCLLGLALALRGRKRVRR